MAKQAATLVGLSLLIDSVVGRPGYLASPIALNKSTFFTEIDPSVIISADWDAVNVVWDSYGVPWSSFLNNAPQPEWWQERLNRTIAATQAWKLPVVLTLPGGAGQNRGCPAENASESGSSYPSVSGTIVCDNDCFDYNTVTNPLASFFRQGYVNFVLYMISAFVPVNVNYAIDANRVLEKCPSEFASYVDFMNQVYDTIKSFYPTLVAYPSLSLESIMGTFPGQPCAGQVAFAGATPPQSLVSCVASGYNVASGLKRDALSLTVRPLNALVNGASGGAPWQLWYLTLVLDVLSAKDAAAVTISQYGYPSANYIVNTANDTVADSSSHFIADVAVAQSVRVTATATTGSEHAAPDPVCFSFFNATVQDSADFFNYVVDVSFRYNIAYTSFFSSNDVLPLEVSGSCPCDTSDPTHAIYCNYLTLYRQACTRAGLPDYACEAAAKITSTLGIRDVDGEAKGTLYAAVQAARSAGAGPLGTAWETVMTNSL